MTDGKTSVIDKSPKEPASVNQTSGPIPQLVSRPASIMCHLLTDDELERIIKIENPIPLSVSSTTGGACLGILPQIIESYKIMGSAEAVAQEKVIEVVIYTSIFVICLTVCAIFGWIARSKGDNSKKALDEIRSRPMHNI